MAKKQEERLLPREQIISTVLGMVVVVIVGTLVYRYFQKGQKEITISPELTQELVEREAGFVSGESLPTTYEIKEGDYLWKISERFYQSGYNWVDIAKENKLNNPDLLYVGQKLTIPDVKARIATVDKLLVGTPIGTGEYTVQKGDWLSKIALRAYGDMFAWEKIYQANKDKIGANPHAIKPGLVLTIPN